MTQNPFDDLQLHEDACFLCGARSGKITQEHVFPKWMQRSFDLWDKRLTLLNSTQLQYRNLRIPCCSKCNGVDLEKVERELSSAVAQGYQGLRTVSERTLYLWAAKIFYGILRKEFSLLRVRRQPEVGSIVPEAALRSFSNLHRFLQGARGCHDFIGTPPYSVLLFNLHDVGGEHRFGFRDSIPHMTLSVCMADIGVIVVFEDGGLAHETYGRYEQAVAGRKLHPIQFEEVYAKVTYQTSLVDSGVEYLTSKTDGDESSCRTTVLKRGVPSEWLQREFAEVLKQHVADWLGNQAHKITWYEAPDKVQTWMIDTSGDLLLKPLDEWNGRSLLPQ